MIRKLSLFLSALAVVFALAGCSQPADPTVSPQLPGPSGELLQFSPVGADETVAVIDTTMGTVTLRFFPDQAPKAVENFLSLAEQGYYNGVIFHRVIYDFMIQGGDPEGTGSGGESKWGNGFGEEISPELYHFRGALCMAKSSLPDSQGSQFYIVTGDLTSSGMYDSTMQSLGYAQSVIDAYKEHGGYFGLDDLYLRTSKGSIGYTVFGQVISGMDVVDAISAVETNASDKPLADVVINSVTVKKYSE
ncbi:MAG: peptidylprolyl isomerase [Ruminococcaceae bacterium]|nr:peptidylprolyl isomerase [Oscillospiraceae bacterium]